MTGTPKILLSTLLAGAAAIGIFWFVLSSRAGEHERQRAAAPRPPAPRPPAPRPETPVELPPPAPVVAPKAEAPVPPPARPASDAVLALQAKAMDLSAEPKDRLAALARLRISQPDGRSPDVVRSMIQLLRTCADASIRADVCRQLNRVESEDLKQQLLVTGRADADPRVREEAIESLGPMKSDPAVKQFLETARAGDPDEKVRLQAQRSLLGSRR